MPSTDGPPGSPPPAWAPPEQLGLGEARPPLPLIGRAREQQLMDAQLDAARAGAARALVVSGEPGIGKSRLCRYAVDRAEGFGVLAARGREAEAELPFEALAELLQPVLPSLGALPSAQAAVLESALRIGPELRAGPQDVGAATLGLLTEAARERPLLAVVEDAQWLDRSSSEALLFAARRLRESRVAILFAAREGERAGLDFTGLDELSLKGLGPAAAHTLLASAPGGEPAPAAVKRLVAEAAGNPLALIELPRALGETQLRGQEPLPSPLPAGGEIERAFAPRLDALDGAARRALVLAAAVEGGEMGTISRALSGMGLDAEALEPAEEAGLIEIAGGTVGFRHPLVRSVAYHAGSAAVRRDAHAALAAVLTDKPERRAWHLAAASVEPAEDVALELELAAEAARSRSSHLGAARANARAAQLTPDPRERGRRLAAAAVDAAHAGGLDWAAALLERALVDTPDPAPRAEVQHLRGVTERLRGFAECSCEILLGAAAEVEPHDGARAAALVAEAAVSHACAGEVREGVALAKRAVRLGEAGAGTGPIPGFVSATLEFLSLLAGEPARPSRLHGALERLLRDPELSPGCFPALVSMVAGLACDERHAEARTLLEGMAGQARASGKRGMLAPILQALGETELQAGRWRPAADHLVEAAALAGDAGQRWVRAASLAGLARIEAARGAGEVCRDHLAQAGELAADATGVLVRVSAARGLLALGTGDVEAAAGDLDRARELGAEGGLGHPLAVPFEPDLIEAHCRAGDGAAAEAALEALERKAERTGSSWAAAAALRCRGMLARADRFQGWFERALAEHARAPNAFERARTELCLGERLRREHRRSDARPHLRAALDAFERLGAEPWAERARKELGASVQTAQRAELDLGLLTPQELQVARIVARGAKNREAAAELFVSKRTIDAHLNSIYRKLNLNSRTQLAQALADEPGGAVAQAPQGVDGNEARPADGAAGLHAAIEVVAATQLVADPDAAERSAAVVELCAAICEQLAIAGEERETLLHAARLHDIGMLAVPREVLEKPGPLTPDEWEAIKHHPLAGERILKAVPELHAVAGIVRHSHEHWDGSGYPDGLSKGRIPQASRVIACAEAFRSLRTERPHRGALSIEQALAEVRAKAGSQFDPKVVEALGRAVAAMRNAGPEADGAAVQAPGAASLSMKTLTGSTRGAERADSPQVLANFLAQALLEPEGPDASGRPGR